MTADKPPSTGPGATAALQKHGRDDPGPVTIADEQTIGVDGDRLRTIAERALGALGIAPDAALSIVLVDADRIAEMKLEAFGERVATDVLSFPLDDPLDPMPGPVMLGDVVICPAVALRQARALGRAPEAELAQLLVHGILHLLGRDHPDARSEHAMAAEERALLEAIGEVAA